MILELLKSLMSQALIIIVFTLLLSKFELFKNIIIIQNKKTSLLNKIILILFFGGIGVLANYTGVPFQGALANSRIIGAFIGGILGGPIVGFLSGLMAGGHRWLIDIGGFTSVACMSATIFEGIIAGLLSKSFCRCQEKWLFAFICSALLEVSNMLIVILIARPFSEAVKLVQIIFLPMIIANSIGVCMIIAIIESIFKEQDRIAADRAQIALKIAEKTLSYFVKDLMLKQLKKLLI